MQDEGWPFDTASNRGASSASGRPTEFTGEPSHHAAFLVKFTHREHIPSDGNTQGYSTAQLPPLLR